MDSMHTGGGTLHTGQAHRCHRKTCVHSEATLCHTQQCSEIRTTKHTTSKTKSRTVHSYISACERQTDRV